jgi:phage-related protein
MKQVAWIGSSRKDIQRLPRDAQKEFGQALWVAQFSGKHENAKPLKGFGGAGVQEVVENHDGNAYRAVYTVRFEEAVYVLHVFQKKSTHGIETSQAA